MSQELFMFLGFTLSAYAIVANDAIQTLGTFIASNQHRSWLTLWGFAASVLTIVLLYGWFNNQGDPSYGRLTAFPYQEAVQAHKYSILCVVPPLALLILTRFGLPVSTTFIILTYFRPKNLESMVTKSLMGYGVAFVAAIVLFFLIRQVMDTNDGEARMSTPWYWTPLQWASTAFLWGQWLIQDLANLFIYFPRVRPEGAEAGSPALAVPLMWLTCGLVLMLVMQAIIFRGGGGRIQEIVNEKSGTSDIKEATLINFVYGLVIYYFKELNNMPMSTTWVFLGLLAGRELAYRMTNFKNLREVEGDLVIVEAVNQTPEGLFRMIGGDLAKATAGLVVSVIIALGLPWVAEIIS